MDPNAAMRAILMWALGFNATDVREAMMSDEDEASYGPAIDDAAEVAGDIHQAYHAWRAGRLDWAGVVQRACAHRAWAASESAWGTCGTDAESFVGLANWMKRGGFAPDESSADELGDHACGLDGT